MAAWLTTLDSLPGLSEDDKARASVLILKERPEDRQLYVSGTQAQARARIRALLSEVAGTSAGVDMAQLMAELDAKLAKQKEDMLEAVRARRADAGKLMHGSSAAAQPPKTVRRRRVFGIAY